MNRKFKTTTAEHEDSDLSGNLPSRIVVYYITGRQIGPLSVPDAWCEECDLTIRAVKTAVAEAGLPDTSVETKPWLSHVVASLRHGGWHPPVVLINGRVFSQGVVPDRVALRNELRGLTSRPSSQGDGDGGVSRL